MERLIYGLKKAMWRLLGLFSPYYRLLAELAGALERGEGAVYFTWTWDGGDPEVDGLVADIDEEVKRLPAPLGADEFFIRVWVYGSRPEDNRGVKDDVRGRRLLRMQSFVFDRYYDWNRGDGKGRFRGFLEANTPSPEAPLVVVGLFPLGGALASLLRDARVQPASPWLR